MTCSVSTEADRPRRVRAERRARHDPSGAFSAKATSGRSASSRQHMHTTHAVCPSGSSFQIAEGRRSSCQGHRADLREVRSIGRHSISSGSTLVLASTTRRHADRIDSATRRCWPHRCPGRRVRGEIPSDKISARVNESHPRTPRTRCHAVCAVPIETSDRIDRYEIESST